MLTQRGLPARPAQLLRKPFPWGRKGRAGESVRGRRPGVPGGVGESGTEDGLQRWQGGLERNPGEQPMCGQAYDMLPLRMSRRLLGQA